MGATQTLTDLVDLYLLRCEVEGKSPRTVRAYRETLHRFLRSVDVDDPAAVTAEYLYGYLGRFTELSLSTLSFRSPRASRLSVWRVLCCASRRSCVPSWTVGILLSKQMVRGSTDEEGPPIGGRHVYVRVMEREMGFEPTALCLGSILRLALCYGSGRGPKSRPVIVSCRTSIRRCVETRRHWLAVAVVTWLRRVFLADDAIASEAASDAMAGIGRVPTGIQAARRRSIHPHHGNLT